MVDTKVMTTTETIWITRDVNADEWGNDSGWGFSTEELGDFGSDTVEGAIAIARRFGFTDIRVEGRVEDA